MICNRPMSCAFVALVVIACSASVVPAQFFLPSLDHLVGSKPTVVRASDLDADGDMDIVSANSVGDSLSILWNDGFGGFTTIQHIQLPINSGATDMLLCDLNQDGAPDLAVTCGFSNELLVALNLGAGTFSPFSVYATDFGPIHLTAEDLDEDGAPELLTTNYGSHSTSVFYNFGNGTFSTIGHIQVGISPSNIQFADFDGDGDRDFAVALMPFAAVSLFENHGTHFAHAGMVAVGAIPIDLVLTDLNNDNIIDIATVNAGTSTISVVPGVGDLTFLPATNYPVPQLPVDLQVGDMDNQLGPDLVTANFNGWSASVLTNDGYGNFSPATVMPMGVNTASVCLADFDGDFFTDMATSNLGPSNVSVLLFKAPNVPYPGTNEDFELYSGVNIPPVSGPGEFIKEAPALSNVNIGVQSPGGTFNNTSVVIGGQLFIAGYPPFNSYPGVHLNAFGFGGAVIFQTPLLSPGGSFSTLVPPPALVGVSILFQAIVPSAIAGNHVFAASNAHEIRITP